MIDISVRHRRRFPIQSQLSCVKAKKEIESVLKTTRKLYPENPNIYVTFSLEILGNILNQTGDLKEGEKVLRQTLQNYNKILTPPNIYISGTETALGENLIARKRFDEAREILSKTEPSLVKVVGEEHRFTKKCRELLASVNK